MRIEFYAAIFEAERTYVRTKRFGGGSDIMAILWQVIASPRSAKHRPDILFPYHHVIFHKLDLQHPENTMIAVPDSIGFHEFDPFGGAVTPSGVGVVLKALSI